MIQEWKNSAGEYHRLDGPAYIGRNGQQWYLNGKRHREDGPARIWAGGDEEWYLNGERHRIDGPAYLRTNGYHEWWIYGIDITDTVYLWIQEQNIPKNYDEWTGMHVPFFV